MVSYSGKVLSSKCSVLQSGVNEATILDLMVKRSNDQRQKTKAAYQLDTGKVRSHSKEFLSHLCPGFDFFS